MYLQVFMMVKLKSDANEVSDYCFKTIDDIEASLQTHPQKYTEWFKIAFPQIKIFHENKFSIAQKI